MFSGFRSVLWVMSAGALTAACAGLATDPFTSAPCSSDLDCPSAYACQVMSASGARSCQPLGNYGEPPVGGGDPTNPDPTNPTPVNPGNPQGAAPCFTKDIKPLMDKYCNQCHGEDPTSSNVFTMRFDQYDNSPDGRMGAKAAATRIKARMSDDKNMPTASYPQQPTAAERDLVKTWFGLGAPECSAQPVMPAPSTPDAGTPVTPAPTGVSFRNQIQPILNQYCLGCHSGATLSGGINLAAANSYASLMAGVSACNAQVRVITAGNAQNSMLYRKIANDPTKCLQSMPPPEGLPNVNPAAVQMIQQWIDQGALNN